MAPGTYCSHHHENRSRALPFSCRHGRFIFCQQWHTASAAPSFPDESISCMTTARTFAPCRRFFNDARLPHRAKRSRLSRQRNILLWSCDLSSAESLPVSSRVAFNRILRPSHAGRLSTPAMWHQVLWLQTTAPNHNHSYRRCIYPCAHRRPERRGHHRVAAGPYSARVPRCRK